MVIEPFCILTVRVVKSTYGVKIHRTIHITNEYMKKWGQKLNELYKLVNGVIPLSNF